MVLSTSQVLYMAPCEEGAATTRLHGGELRPEQVSRLPSTTQLALGGAVWLCLCVSRCTGGLWQGPVPCRSPVP